jgi:hypothetical protein
MPLAGLLPDSRSGRLAWVLAAFFAATQLVLAWVSWDAARASSVTYVFTPILDVEPAGAPLSADEAARLDSDLPHGMDRSDVSGAFALLGSTLSLDDLLHGVEKLEAAGKPLDAHQSKRIGSTLAGARDDYRSMIEVQSDILDTELVLRQQIDELLALLPPDVASRIPQSSKAPVRAPAPASGSSP